MSRTIKEGVVYRHFKGKLYKVLSIAEHSETGESLVVYKAIHDEKVYVRPLWMFASKVDKEKYPKVEQEYRFEEVETAGNTEKNVVRTLPKIVAIDFDGTLVQDRYPKIGEPIDAMFELCRQLKGAGIKLILWTCRTGEWLDDAIEFCRLNGLAFDAVNRNVDEVVNMFNNDTRKVYADLYIDDKSIPNTMSPGFWIHRLGMRFSLYNGVYFDGV